MKTFFFCIPMPDIVSTNIKVSKRMFAMKLELIFKRGCWVFKQSQSIQYILVLLQLSAWEGSFRQIY